MYERPSINYPKFGSSKSSSGSGGASRLDAIPRRKPGEAIIKEMEEEKERMRTEQRPQPKGKGGGGGPGVSVRLLTGREGGRGGWEGKEHIARGAAAAARRRGGGRV